MNTRHDNADGPEDIDKAFAEIVAELERDTSLPRWPGDHEQTPGTEEHSTVHSESASSSTVDTSDSEDGPRDWTPEESEEPRDDEGHYEPPEPPPLPTPGAGAVSGVALVALGLIMLLVPAVAGWLGGLAMPAGLIAVSGGIGWLLLRLRHGSSDAGFDDDDGAQV